MHHSNRFLVSLFLIACGSSPAPTVLLTVLFNAATATASRTSTIDDADTCVLATGDFNGDQAPDIASVDCNDSGLLSVRLNQGDGTFAPPTTITVNAMPWHLAAGDLNGDGHVDLVVVSNENDTA